MNSELQSHVDALAEYVATSGWVKFREMNEFLESRGISVNIGDEELLGEHVRQSHIDPGTTLLGPTSEEYVAIVERLFKSYPVSIMIGDMASFGGDEPWWVDWNGTPYDSRVDIAQSRRPPVNPDVHDIADRVKHCFYKVTEELASAQYQLAELAGTGELKPETSMGLQQGLVEAWEALYAGTLCAVHDDNTRDLTWAEAENTYSDGRQIRTKIRVEPEETSELTCEHNRFTLGDGAVAEHPRGTICYIAPVNPSDNTSQEINEGSTAVGGQSRPSLVERLRRHRRDQPCDGKSAAELWAGKSGPNN